MGSEFALLNYIKEERPSFGEKCGIVGIFSLSGNAPFLTRRALAAVQHRGQEAAGITAFQQNQILKTHHGFGLVPDAIPNKALDSLGESTTAIAHNRYSTIEGGRSDCSNIQPIHLRHGPLEISLGHNGNLFDTSLLNQTGNSKMENPSDSYLLTAFLLQQRKLYTSWQETLKISLPEISNLGAFSLVILTDGGILYGARDPHGIRPLVLGQLNDGWVIASETVALDMVKADFMREVKPGEIVEITQGGDINFHPYGQPRQSRPCIFEDLYFARPDSWSDNRRIQTGREESGRRLARRMIEKGIHPEVTVPVLDSGMWAALGVFEQMKNTFTPAVITDHYKGRIFIRPGQDNRQQTTNNKHNFTPEGVQGKDTTFIDDSTVRFTTSPTIVNGLREVGASQVHAGFASPPVVDSCDLGIDTNRPKGKELPASRWADQQLDVIEARIAEMIGADSATYLPIGELAQAFGRTPDQFCYHCFGGPHPIQGEQQVFRQKERLIIGKPKIAVFISGSGTNLQQLIDGVENNDIDGEIIEVISNQPEALGIKRAQEHNIPTSILPSDGKLKDSQKRLAYEQKLIQEIQQNPPDVIVLAGWMLVLGDRFLQTMQEMEIPVLNLHPALLTPDDQQFIATSRGQIPVLRGTHAIQDAYDQKLPVSGVTVHQLLPGQTFDVGPIILQEEVRKKEEETLEEWEKRIHEAEYRTLPSALKRVLHVMKHNIDVSRGDFPW
jgi:amidophosphoribosyltransferase